MANLTITELPPNGTPDLGAELPIQQAGITGKVSVAELKSVINPGTPFAPSAASMWINSSLLLPDTAVWEDLPSSSGVLESAAGYNTTLNVDLSTGEFLSPGFAGFFLVIATGAISKAVGPISQKIGISVDDDIPLGSTQFGKMAAEISGVGSDVQGFTTHRIVLVNPGSSVRLRFLDLVGGGGDPSTLERLQWSYTLIGS